MTTALIILHTAPDASDLRAYTALRLAGAMLADNKDVTLFLVEGGAHLLAPTLSADNPCCALFNELCDAGLIVQICGSTMQKLGWGETCPRAGISKSSMKALSALLGEADEIVTF